LLLFLWGLLVYNFEVELDFGLGCGFFLTRLGRRTSFDLQLFRRLYCARSLHLLHRFLGLLRLLRNFGPFGFPRLRGLERLLRLKRLLGQRLQSGSLLDILDSYLTIYIIIILTCDLLDSGHCFGLNLLRRTPLDLDRRLLLEQLGWLLLALFSFYLDPELLALGWFTL